MRRWAEMLRIRQEREQRGWSQARLARRARISVSDMSRIEGGWLRPYPNQLRRLAKALDWPAQSADELLVMSSSERPVSDQQTDSAAWSRGGVSERNDL